ncbi:MAG: right-handed parallel beta-helix repeat-containing protein [Candidatus Kariarchaeaceae archaeon]
MNIPISTTLSYNQAFENQKNPTRPSQLGNLTPRNKINFWGDEGFEEFPGSGTEGDPYIIANFEISSPNSDDYDLIAIHDTSAYFIIENNYLTGNNVNSGFGIKLSHVENGLIRNNEIYDTTHGGISLEDSNTNILEFNTISGHQTHGLTIWQSFDIEIRNNIFEKNQGDGIASYFSNGNLLTNNTLSFNSFNGIRIEFSNDHVIQGNLVTSNIEGGIWLGGANRNIVDSNKVSNHDLGIIITIVDGTGNSGYNIIRNNEILDGIQGIYLLEGFDNIIEQNQIDGNIGNSILFERAINNNVSYNHVSNGAQGFGIRGANTKDNILTCNVFENHLGYGFRTGPLTKNLTVYQNDFANNQQNPQAYDDGLDNIFENNYWSEIGSTDLDDDGINDLQYNIAGGSDNADFFPLAQSIFDVDNENSICAVNPANLGLNNTTLLDIRPQLNFPIPNSMVIGIPLIAVLLAGIILYYKRKV